MIKSPFQQWGLDFIGPINPPSSQGYACILISINFLSKWVESKPMKKTNFEVVCEFLNENIFVRFGVPLKLIMHNASYFSSLEIIEFFYDHGIFMSHYFEYFH